MQRYDAERRPVMDEVTLRNRALGPEAGMQLVEERAPNGFTRIEDVISRSELESIAKSFSVAASLVARSRRSHAMFGMGQSGRTNAAMLRRMSALPLEASKFRCAGK